MLRDKLIAWRQNLKFSNRAEYLREVAKLDKDHRECAAAMWPTCSLENLVQVILAFHELDVYYKELHPGDADTHHVKLELNECVKIELPDSRVVCVDLSYLEPGDQKLPELDIFLPAVMAVNAFSRNLVPAAALDNDVPHVRMACQLTIPVEGLVCDPTDACKTHGRCWTHSYEEDKKPAESEPKLKLVRTSMACPEQYDGYINDEKVAYLRLRHGHFYAQYKDVTVYETDDIFGNGHFFSAAERKTQLTAACALIIDAHKNNGVTKAAPLYELIVPSGYETPDELPLRTPKSTENANESVTTEPVQEPEGSPPVPVPDRVSQHGISADGASPT